MVERSFWFLYDSDLRHERVNCLGNASKINKNKVFTIQQGSIMKLNMFFDQALGLCGSYLTRFIVHFSISLPPETFGFLTFSVGIEIEHRAKMG